MFYWTVRLGTSAQSFSADKYNKPDFLAFLIYISKCLALIQQAVHLSNPLSVKGHFLYHFCPLSVCTAARASIRKARDALCCIFQVVIVCYHWGIDKYDSKRVQKSKFMWEMSFCPFIKAVSLLFILSMHVCSLYGISSSGTFHWACFSHLRCLASFVVGHSVLACSVGEVASKETERSVQSNPLWDI